MTRPNHQSRAYAESIRLRRDRERAARPVYLRTGEIRLLVAFLAGGWSA